MNGSPAFARMIDGSRAAPMVAEPQPVGGSGGAAVQVAEGLFVSHRALRPDAPWIEAWRRLSRDALVPNLFFDPDFALAALPAFGAGVGALLVTDRPPEYPGARLLAFWPFRSERLRWGLPIPVLVGWTHPFCLFGVPLLDADDPEPALCALLGAPSRLGLARRLLLTYVPQAGPFAEVLAAAQRRLSLRGAAFWEHERAYLAAASPGYLEHLSSRKRRKLGQQFRRLEAGGPVHFETIRGPDAVRAAADDYIALETAGWKGREGTAIGCSPHETAFIQAAVAAMAQDGRVRIDRLTRAGRTLAASIAFRTGATLWYLKISFDEAEAKNSPGQLLVQAVTQSLLADPEIAVGDSCAPPSYPLMETFWDERLRLANVLLEAEGGGLTFPLAARLERIRERGSLAVRAFKARRKGDAGKATAKQDADDA